MKKCDECVSFETCQTIKEKFGDKFLVGEENCKYFKSKNTPMTVAEAIYQFNNYGLTDTETPKELRDAVDFAIEYMTNAEREKDAGRKFLEELKK